MLLAATAIATFGVVGSASAVVFNVNSTKDSPDKTDVDGLCKAKNGKCTLRAAVTEANVQPGLDVVKLGKGTFRLTIPGNGDNDEGDFDVFEQLKITGAGAGDTTIRQTAHERILEGHASSAITVTKAKLTGGRGDTRGGAIYSPGSLTVKRVTLSGNEVTGSTLGGATGGAIRADGTLTVVSSKVINNTAHATNETADGGGIEALGSNNLIDRSLIAGNVATKAGGGSDAVGGGIEIGDQTHILESTIRDNSAHAGAGVFSNSSDPVLIEASTLSGNVAGDRGGGISTGNGNMTIFNSTLSDNKANGSPGGGALIRFGGGVSIQYTTVAGNKAPVGSAIQAGTGAGNVTFLASLIANPGSDCANAASHVGSNGFNLYADGTCGLAGVGDTATMQPKLGHLADNGGPTKTRALKSGSPAIDLVTANCPPPTTDQRGEPRPGGGDCDAGSYEK